MKKTAQNKKTKPRARILKHNSSQFFRTDQKWDIPARYTANTGLRWENSYITTQIIF